MGIDQGTKYIRLNKFHKTYVRIQSDLLDKWKSDTMGKSFYEHPDFDLRFL